MDHACNLSQASTAVLRDDMQGSEGKSAKVASLYHHGFLQHTEKFERKCLKSNLVVVHWVRKIRTKLGLHLKRIKQECMIFSQQISMSYNLRKTNIKLTSVETVSGRGGELITPRRAAHVSSNCCLEVHPDNKKQHTRIFLSTNLSGPKIPSSLAADNCASIIELNRILRVRGKLTKQLNETEPKDSGRY